MKHIKGILYADPGVGKSVFANAAPNRFFITTDGNYEYLEEFGAKPEDHVQVHSWAETKALIDDIVEGKYDKYETFVVDLLEDMFKWDEFEYCKKNSLEDVGDLGYGKGYNATRNDFVIEISRLLSVENKNVILLMHGITYTTKDRRGIEHTRHAPSDRLPAKVFDQLEGRVRFVLRAYLKAEEVDGKLIKKRYLSLTPKENETAILRGINENKIPSDIPLDFKVFANTIGLEIGQKPEIKEEPKTQINIADIKPEAQHRRRRKVEPEVVEEAPKEQEPIEVKAEDIPEPKAEEKVEVKVEEKVEVKEEPAPAPQPETTSSKNDKLAALLAKLRPHN